MVTNGMLNREGRLISNYLDQPLYIKTAIGGCGDQSSIPYDVKTGIDKLHSQMLSNWCECHMSFKIIF